MRMLKSHHPHLFVTRSREGNLQVVEPGSSDSIEPVDHLLQRTKSSLSGTMPCHTSYLIHSNPSFLFWVNKTDFGWRYLSHTAEWIPRRALKRGSCSAVDKSATKRESDRDAEWTQWTLPVTAGRNSNAPAEGAVHPLSFLLHQMALKPLRFFSFICSALIMSPSNSASAPNPSNVAATWGSAV